MDHVDHAERALSTPPSRTDEIKAHKKEETEEKIEVQPIHSQPNKVLSEPCLRTSEALAEQCAPVTKERAKNNDEVEIESSPAPKAVLEKLINTYGDAADILKEAIVPTLEGKQALGEMIDLFQDNVTILSPEGVQKLGVVAEILKQLSEANAIVSDSILLGRKVQEYNGKKVLLLAKPLSEAIISALNELAHRDDIAIAKKAFQKANQSPYQKKRFWVQEKQRSFSVLSKPVTESVLREKSKSTTNKATPSLADAMVKSPTLA